MLTSSEQRCSPAPAMHTSMEADIASMEERKEGGSGALLDADDHADGGPSDFSLPPPHGQ